MEAFTIGIRSYDKSMIGVIGINTPDSNKVGVARQMTYNPKIINNRGIIQVSEHPEEELDGSNIFTPVELLSPFTALHADPPRISMQAAQTKHMIPTDKQSKTLFGSGVEKTMAYNIGGDFVFRAKKDGKVVKIDDKNEIATLAYKDGTYDYIDLSSIQSKNSNGGFYTTNKKEMIFKEGDSFKEDQVIAKNSLYFLGDKDDVTYASGYLTKIAMHSGDYTLEDSSIITEQLSEDMTSYITMCKTVGIGYNSNIISYKKKGDSIKTGENLIVFEQSFEDKEASKLLANIDPEYSETLDDIGRNRITSKWTGDIADVKIYYNRDIEEMSESMQAMLNEYIKKIESRRKIVKDGGVSNIIIPSIEKTEYKKIGNTEFDGIYIEYYIRYKDNLSIGDKITFTTALKTIVSDVIEKGEEPYSEYRPDENINAILSPMSVVSRMTTDIFNIMYLNKCIIELKRKCKDIYNK